MIQLHEEELDKLSDITEVPYYNLQKLYDMGMLNDVLALDYLIRYDYQRIKKTGRYQPKQIVLRLSEFYSVSENKVRSAIYRKRNRYYYCTKCSKRISKYLYHKNSGLCNQCVARLIEL